MTPTEAPTPNRRLRCRLVLPADFRAPDILAFHDRDAAQVAERVEDSALHKGLVWEGRPALLRISFEGDLARVTLAVDGTTAGGSAALRSLAARMLGLTQDVETFERLHAGHPLLGSLIARNRGLRVPLAASPFEALGWAITGQQISVNAAIAVRRRLIQACGPRHSSGLWCYPDAPRIAALGEDGLLQAGFSRGKARTLVELSGLVADGSLPLDEWLAHSAGPAPAVAEEIRERLLAIRGIGPWTVSYALLRGFGWLDGSLHGDVAVRRNLQALLGAAAKLGEDETRHWLAQFSPWRALLAAHLWAMQKSDGY